MRRKCYISGRISGLPWGEVERNFSSAVLRLFGRGFVPVSPLNNGLPRFAPWFCHMIIDIINMLMCDAVLMLDNWESSKGARIEHRIAQATNKLILYDNNP